MSAADKSWNDLQLTHLFYAYRKAKADCFSEHSMCVAEKFVAYENGLAENLDKLLSQLQGGEIGKLLQDNLVDSEFRIVAKKLGLMSKLGCGVSGGHLHAGQSHEGTV